VCILHFLFMNKVYWWYLNKWKNKIELYILSFHVDCNKRKLEFEHIYFWPFSILQINLRPIINLVITNTPSESSSSPKKPKIYMFSFYLNRSAY
jgi:hypothetical protein